MTFSSPSLISLFFLDLSLQNAMLVYISEIAIDIIKHSFIAKFNDIKPIAYSEFLEDLCRQVLDSMLPSIVIWQTPKCSLHSLIYISLMIFASLFADLEH